MMSQLIADLSGLIGEASAPDQLTWSALRLAGVTG